MAVGTKSGRSPLQQMVEMGPTCLWNDSAAVSELEQSIVQGAVGATCNPVIVGDVLKLEWSAWKDRIPQIVAEMPTANEDAVAWRLTEEMSVKAAKLLEPIFRREKGRNGRLSIQTDPRNWRSPEALLKQALHFTTIAPNIIVKMPVTEAGVQAIEEATAAGVSINATVSFSVPQAIAVADAVERGLKRRERDGLDIASMGPVCTIMVGRLDDWLKAVAEKEGIVYNPGIFDWAGVAVMKKAYRLYRQRGYRLRLLSAGFRTYLHWYEFIGGDVVISPPWKWQTCFIKSGLEAKPRMDAPVDRTIIDELLKKSSEFGRAWRENGMKPAEFEAFGTTRRTLRQFVQAWHDLTGVVREFMLPNPDK
jgi:transaldolase